MIYLHCMRIKQIKDDICLTIIFTSMQFRVNNIDTHIPVVIILAVVFPYQILQFLKL